MLIFNHLAPLFLIIFGIVCFIERKPSIDIRSQLTNFHSPSFWMILFYVMHLIGMLWTVNYSKGWEDIGMKLSFLVVPFFFAIGNIKLSRDLLEKWLIRFTLILLFGLYTWAIYKSIHYYEDNHWAYFFESEFSAVMHRSYLGTYLVFVSFIALASSIKKNKRKLLNLFSFIIISIASFQTLSKSAMIIWALLFIIFITWWIIKNQKIYIGLGIIILFIFGISYLFNINSRLIGRLEEIPKAIKSFKNHDNKSAESNEARLIMWSTSLIVIKHHPIIGAGTGDVKDELIAKNFALGNTTVAEEKLNSHNQYLNTWTQLGIIGLILLLMIYLTLIILAIRNRDYLIGLFVFVLFISMLFESFIEIQSGIIPFTVLIMCITLPYFRGNQSGYLKKD
jgi:O-antigen ligase